MKPWILCVILISRWAAFGQEPAGKLIFEVASIKPSQPMPMGQMRIMMGGDAGMLRYTNVSLRDCIRVAYRVKEFQVEGPEWLGNTRFDITAKLPEGSSRDQIPEMLQALLTERFKLVVHHDTKEHAIYAMVVGKGGPKLKPAEEVGAMAGDGPKDGEAPKGGIPRGAMMMQVDGAGAHLKAPSATLAGLAEMISRFSERPVVDMTGIQGQYSFDLVFAPESLRSMPGGPGGRGPMQPPGEGGHQPADGQQGEAAGTIYQSVQRYGLKLEPKKAPMDMLVVDQMEKTPTEN